MSTRPWTTCCKPVQHIGSSILGQKTGSVTEGFNVNCKTSSAAIRGINFPLQNQDRSFSDDRRKCSMALVGLRRGAGTGSTPPLRTSPCHVRVGWFSERGYNIPHARRSTRPGIPTPDDRAVFEGRDRGTSKISFPYQCAYAGACFLRQSPASCCTTCRLRCHGPLSARVTYDSPALTGINRASRQLFRYNQYT